MKGAGVVESIHIHTKAKDYDVWIGADAYKDLGSWLLKKKYSKLLVVTDKNVGELHKSRLESFLPSSLPVYWYSVPAGEEAKSMHVLESCLTFALEARLDRHSCIAAFGGGAVGDLAGFAASAFMRGIDFIQLPTTVLAHDSAVGGKTGVNHPLGKNLIGAFHQPAGVFYNTGLLATLPAEELRSGFAEAVKHALIADGKFLGELMSSVRSLDELSHDQWIPILKRGMEIKAGIVEKDERESDIRAHLNFGHTLGHAIEAELGFGSITHGEAVMIGMIYALHLSEDLYGLDFPIAKFASWAASLGYKTDIPAGITFEAALEKMRLDKKAEASRPRFVLLEQVGKPVLTNVDAALLKKVYGRCRSADKYGQTIL